MTLSDLSTIVGVISGLAVLGSLIYLAQQTRQNAKHTRALIQQGRSIQTSDTQLRLAEHPSLAEIRYRGDEGDPTLDRAQIARYFFVRAQAFSNFEDQFHQRRDGLLDEDRFAATVKIFENQFQSPGVRLVWMGMRTLSPTEFRSFVDDIMRRTRVSTWEGQPSVESWKAGIEAVLSEARA